MRRNLVHPGAGQLKYEIRQIVQFAHEIEKFGVPITWENIGDPIHKGESLPDWMRSVVAARAAQNASYSYVDTQGIPETREFLAAQARSRGGVNVAPSDIIFFNGLGDAVSKVFGALRREARVLGPSPAYSTHSSAEAAHSGYEHLTYRLDPANGWMPDLDEIENTVRYNDSIAGLLVINPDNPTGAVYSREILEGFVRIARAYDIFLLFDETYANITYNGAQFVGLAEVIDDVPGISLRSISKDFPWPGARCGWAEVYNQSRDENFRAYVTSILDAKRLEVCSSNLPQAVIPEIFSDPRFRSHLERRRRMFEARANEAFEAFAPVSGIRVTRPRGGLYVSLVFESAALPADGGVSTPGWRADGVLSITDASLDRFVAERSAGLPPDKQFVYRMLAATGICVVPLSGFATDLPGIRMTLLESDDRRRRWIYATVAASIEAYLTVGAIAR